MYGLTKLYFPQSYAQHLKLRDPWFVGLTSNGSFPRLTVTSRAGKGSIPLFGPFRSRDAAQHYEQEVQTLFQIRRCTDALVPEPTHPGCIYGEMNQCLRPCQAAVTVDEYRSETARVAEFLRTNGRTATGILALARDRAAEETDFEQASYLHKRIEKIAAVGRVRDEVISEIHEFSGVALTRSVQHRHCRLWPMVNGTWQEPLTLAFSGQDFGVRSLDHDISQKLANTVKSARKTSKIAEEFSLFSRWYYSAWRDGDWFPFQTVDDLNYRKLVRAISRLVEDGQGKAVENPPC